jgi:hypothetical protein
MTMHQFVNIAIVVCTAIVAIRLERQMRAEKRAEVKREAEEKEASEAEEEMLTPEAEELAFADCPPENVVPLNATIH